MEEKPFLCHVWEKILSEDTVAPPHKSPHRREAVPMQILQSELQTQQHTDNPHEETHRREAVFLSKMWKIIPSEELFDNPHAENPHARETVPL